jgi:hypothetical protein
VCEGVHRKARGESWEIKTCKDCYRLLDFFTWSNKWNLARTYLKNTDFLIDANLTKV